MVVTRNRFRRTPLNPQEFLMLGGLAKSLFGSSNDRYVKSLGSIVNKINSFEPTISAMSDADLSNQTAVFREQLANGTKLDDLLPEVFATVREAAKRTLGQRHYDVQMVGGIVLHRGEIAEMRTGEGKTLVATLATYLNADTYALVDIFCPTLIVDAELQSVSVFELERARVLVGRRKADVVEERAGAALGILDEKLATEFAPDLRVGASNDL